LRGTTGKDNINEEADRFEDLFFYYTNFQNWKITRFLI
jgi:hypothetical protein